MKDNIAQTANLITIDKIGLILNMLRFDVVGRVNSLENSLIASLKGWNSPIIPTLLGPFRSWEYPKILRSSKVIKATLIKTGIITKINETSEVIYNRNTRGPYSSLTTLTTLIIHSKRDKIKNKST